MNDIAIAAGLGITINPDDIKSAAKLVPKNCFGVFISVHRSKDQQLNVWPKDIHGCIGYWDKEYNVVAPEIIIKKMIQVSYDSTWKDSRNKKFNRPIYEDPYGKYEIYFMLKPLLKIDNTTGIMLNGKPFDNSKYGLIVENKRARATYLPNVFPQKSWSYIRNSLTKKQGSSRSRNGRNQNIFYAYKSVIKSQTIYNLLNKKYIGYLMDTFPKFMNENYIKFVPYEVVNNVVKIKRNEHVRNIATMSDLFYFKSKLTPTVLRTIKGNLAEYKNPGRQASAFLLQGLHRFGILDTKMKHKLCSSLYEAIPDLEPRFELGEVLIALSEVCPNNSKLRMNMRLNQPYNIDDVFEYNWNSKFVYERRSGSGSGQSRLLAERLNWIAEKLDSNSETNYLATAFEGLCSLLGAGEKTVNKQLIFKLFYLLEKRRSDGLYYFLNNTARIDITGHVINGLKILYDNNRYANKN
jgi:AMMECR1 domain-containing protein